MLRRFRHLHKKGISQEWWNLPRMDLGTIMDHTSIDAATVWLKSWCESSIHCQVRSASLRVRCKSEDQLMSALLRVGCKSSIHYDLVKFATEPLSLVEGAIQVFDSISTNVSLALGLILIFNSLPTYVSVIERLTKVLNSLPSFVGLIKRSMQILHL